MASRASRRSGTAKGASGASGSGREMSSLEARRRQRDRQMATSYVLGTDRGTWETEYHLIKPTRLVAAPAKTKMNRNASDARDIFGDVKVDPREHYASESSKTFAAGKSVMSSGYARAKPLPGFDRKTANRTNYSLGGEGVRTEYRTQNMEATMPPKEMKARGINPTYKARRDLGYNYDIITGRSRDLAKTYVPKGGRRSQDVAVADVTKHTRYNIISGRVEGRTDPPPKRTAEAVSSKAKLGSLACLRPPTGQELL